MTNSATPAPTNPPHIALVASAAEGIGSATVIADVKPQRTELDGIAEEVKVKGRQYIVGMRYVTIRGGPAHGA